MKVKVVLLDHGVFSAGYCLEQQAAVDDLLQGNQALLAELASHRGPLVLASGWLEQSVSVGSRGEVSSIPIILPVFQAALEAMEYQEAVQASIDLFLLADIFGLECQGGESYCAMLRLPQKPENYLGHEDKRITLLYAHAHRAAVLNPGCSIEVHYYTSRKDIVAWLAYFYQRYAGCLPDNVKLCLQSYPDKKKAPKFPSVFIQGAGTVNRQYEWLIRYWAARFSGRLSDDSSEFLCANSTVADKLVDFHKEQEYHVFMRLVDTIRNEETGSQFSGFSVLAEINRLPCFLSADSKNQYVTAEDLCEHQRLNRALLKQVVRSVPPLLARGTILSCFTGMFSLWSSPRRNGVDKAERCPLISSKQQKNTSIQAW